MYVRLNRRLSREENICVARRACEDNVKLQLKGMGCENVEGIDM